VGLPIFLFTFFGAFAPLVAVDRPDTLPLAKQEAPCWSGDFATDEIDSCALLEQALGFLSRLESSSAAHLRKLASGFDPERSLRIQQALLREDLIWQNRGYSARQLDLMVFIAVALTVQSATEREIELRSSGEDGADPKMKRRLERIQQYKHEAIAFLDRISPDLENVREYELKFYF
jgi:hypothetical protein